MITQLSIREKLLLVIIVTVAMTVTAKVYLSSRHVSITAVSPRVSADGTVRLLFSNPGADEILLMPEGIYQRMNDVTVQRDENRPDNMVIPAGKTVECKFLLPRGSDALSSFQLRYRCHRRAKDPPGFLRWNNSISKYLSFMLFRIENMLNDGKETGVSILDGNREVRYKKEYYEITSPVFIEYKQSTTNEMTPF